MPIISQETWDKFSPEEKEKIRRAMREIPNEKASVEVLLIQLFPKKALQPQSLTYKDVAKKLFLNRKFFYGYGEEKMAHTVIYNNSIYDDLNCTSEKQFKKICAINCLLNTAKFLNRNEDGTPWKPNWENLNEEKWYFELDDNKIKINYTEIGYCSRIVYFRTEQLAKQAVAILGEDTVRLALSSDY